MASPSPSPSSSIPQPPPPPSQDQNQSPPSPKPTTPTNTTTKKTQPLSWTHQETINLIQAYQEKWYSLKKGQLKAGQWEEVAITVTARCDYDEPSKSATQCRHKIEKLCKWVVIIWIHHEWVNGKLVPPIEKEEEKTVSQRAARHRGKAYTVRKRKRVCWKEGRKKGQTQSKTNH